MSNWKSPGLDLAKGFCLKNFSSLHWRVRLQLKICLNGGFYLSGLLKEGVLYCRKIKANVIFQVVIDL